MYTLLSTIALSHCSLRQSFYAKLHFRDFHHEGFYSSAYAFRG